MRRAAIIATAVAVLLFAAATATRAFDFEPVSVKDSSYTLAGVSPKGANVTWAYKVKLSNDVGERQKVTLTVQLLDSSGYELDHATKKVTLDMWESKEVTGKGKMHCDLWDKVVSANYKVEARP